MTEPESSEGDELLKADALGRVRDMPGHREIIPIIHIRSTETSTSIRQPAPPR